MKQIINRIWTVLLAFVCVASSVSAVEKGKSPRPNILLIVMDDLGYADVGFMPNAAKDIYTPNIDKLAEGGTIFTSAYVTHPYCGPSRTGLMTGRMPHVFGAQFNLAAFSGYGVASGELFMSDVLQSAGYHTGIVGKWHLGEEGEFHPNERGFDYFYGFLGGGHEYHSRTWLPAKTYNPEGYQPGAYGMDYNRPMMKNKTYLETGKDKYVTDVLTDATLEFIDESSEKEKPFFLYLSYNAPHTPLQAKQSDIAEIQQKLGKDAAQKGSKRLTYTAMMYNVDYNIQRIVEKLEEKGELENTMIVFISDNGGKTPAGANNQPLKGRKGDAYEGGFRVPMFVYYPNSKMKKGDVNTHNFSALDFFPTFAAIAGADIPKDKILDGKNVWKSIENNTDPRKDESVYVLRHYFRIPRNGNVNPSNIQKFNDLNKVGVVRNNFKLYSNGDGEWKLFDLSTDIGETKNIAAKHPELVKDMKATVNEWTYTWEDKRPEFFDAPHYNFEANWNKFNMPNFEKTFGEMHLDKKSK
ncbi:sulfatase-like hydrolase/transferase [Flammeovirga agarivorans]|uniref:Sulfatase-like hydrolase/transferase n=1 Tax=Flammeovirga agarivorans TaxID=2726742 RepID=A0A7X8XXU2_9BACT|nr:sulfatase-like hydrolase/transferase [Flammeovirga agarivorans]NLR93410.1 sulfatase-like hydrolase/transferase [Flammeovirga agarivorans]